MTRPQQPADFALRIQSPCSKQWSELIGDDKRRYCSACSLHVHDAGHLSRREAQDLVSSAEARVCMRIEYDPSGSPIFRDSAPASVADERGQSLPRSRLARWVISAGAGILAACNGSFSTAPSAGSGVGAPPSTMGKVCSTERLGDVASPPPPVQRLGEVAVQPTSPVLSPETRAPDDRD